MNLLTNDEKTALAIRHRIAALNSEILILGKKIRQQMEICPHPHATFVRGENWKYRARIEVVYVHTCNHCGKKWETTE
jgi:hypothetical protein